MNLATRRLDVRRSACRKEEQDTRRNEGEDAM